jgi:hypothetical protein
VIKPASDVVDDLGRFLFTRQWFDQPDDPFGRGPSVMSYDRSKDAIVQQDHRAWIAGLSDEGGAGSWLAAAIKLFGRPDAAELRQYQRFVDEVLWGRIQYAEGDRRYGVRKSLFIYARRRSRLRRAGSPAVRRRTPRRAGRAGVRDLLRLSRCA